MQALARFIYFKLLRWTMEGRFPTLDKCVVIVAPHTSWWDFVLGLLVRTVIGTEVHFVAKDSLFKPPFGWFFRWMGGAPVDRSRSSDSVKAISRIFAERRTFRLALAPEGTRKKVRKWKTGFYYIAKSASVPIVLVAFDYGRKMVRISGPKFPTGNIMADLEGYHDFYGGVKGKVPENSF
jgi:1-acyl-sn-glycerol-3-phosphate acyltransferase